MNDLAVLYYNQGQYEKAEPLYVASLELRRIALEQTHLDTLNSMNNLAGLYRSRGQYGKAEPLYMVACLDQRRIAWGQTHSDTHYSSMNDLAGLYYSRGQYEKVWRATVCDLSGAAKNRIGADSSTYSSLDE